MFMSAIGDLRTAVITAMGVAAPGALDPESFLTLVRNGQTAISRIQRVDTAESGCSFGGEVPPFDLTLLPGELKPKRLARHTEVVLWAAQQLKSEVDKLPASPFIRLGDDVNTRPSRN